MQTPADKETERILNEAAKKEEESIKKSEEAEKAAAAHQAEVAKQVAADLAKKEEVRKHEEAQRLKDDEARKVRTAKLLEEKTEKAKELHGKIQDVIAEYDGLVSNIPVTHSYWGMMNEYRALLAK